MAGAAAYPRHQAGIARERGARGKARDIADLGPEHQAEDWANPGNRLNACTAGSVAATRCTSARTAASVCATCCHKVRRPTSAAPAWPSSATVASQAWPRAPNRSLTGHRDLVAQEERVNPLR